jgi:hypothetical protein
MLLLGLFSVSVVVALAVLYKTPSGCYWLATTLRFVGAPAVIVPIVQVKDCTSVMAAVVMGDEET